MPGIHHRREDKSGAFYYEVAGTRLAEMSYHLDEAGIMIVDHTLVDPSLKGQGIGRQLQEQLVAYARQTGIRVLPLCPFARANFEKTTAWQDVLAEPHN